MPSSNSNKYNAYRSELGNKGMVGKKIPNMIGYQNAVKKTTAYALQQEQIKGLSKEPELSRCFVNHKESYFYYQLPSQNVDDIINEENTEGYTFVIYSQQHQNEIDKVDRETGLGYFENSFMVEQGEKKYIFVDTFNSQDEGVEAYMKKYPDALYLGLGTYKDTRSFE